MGIVNPEKVSLQPETITLLLIFTLPVCIICFSELCVSLAIQSIVILPTPFGSEITEKIILKSDE